MVDEGGATRVGFLLAPTITAADLSQVTVQVDDRPVLGRPDAAPLNRSRERQSARLAVVWHLPAGRTAAIGRFRLTLPPPPSRLTRLAIAGAANYPTAADLKRVARPAGGPIDGVLLLGAGLEHRLGSGGWENRLPILAMPSGTACALCTGLPVPVWPRGLAWAPSALPRPRTVRNRHWPSAASTGRGAC
jgi:hypothetical protein